MTDNFTESTNLNKEKNFMTFNKEPAVIINGLSGLLTQILPLLVVVGLLQLTPERLAALVSIIGLVLTFVSTTLLRSQVVPTVRANKQIQEGIDSSEGTKVEDVIATVEKKEEEGTI